MESASPVAHGHPLPERHPARACPSAGQSGGIGPSSKDFIANAAGSFEGKLPVDRELGLERRENPRPSGRSLCRPVSLRHVPISTGYQDAKVLHVEGARTTWSLVTPMSGGADTSGGGRGNKKDDL